MDGAPTLQLPNLSVRLLADSSHFDRVIAGVEKTVSKAAAKLTKLGTKLSLAVTTPLTTLGVLGVREFAKFDDAMTKSLAIMSGITPEIRKQMEGIVFSLAEVSPAAPEQLAEAYFFLASAGLDAKQAMSALPQVMKFGTAGAFDFARATDLATDAQSALGLTVKDPIKNLENLTRVTDVLVTANNLANASVEQFSVSLTTKAGDALRRVGKDVEEGVSILAAWADQGVKAELAGERLNIVLRDLQTAYRKNTDVWKGMNLEVFDTAGNMLPVTEILKRFEKQFASLSVEQRGSALAMLGFQDRSVAAFASLIGLSGRIQGYEDALRKAGGETQRVADKQMQSFSNQMKIVWNNVKLASIEIGAVLAPAVGMIGNKIKELTQWFRGLEKEQQQQIVKWGAIAAAVGPVLLALGALAASFNSILFVLKPFSILFSGIGWIARKTSGMFTAAMASMSASAKGAGFSMTILDGEAIKSTASLRVLGLTGPVELAKVAAAANTTALSVSRMNTALATSRVGSAVGTALPIGAAVGGDIIEGEFRVINKAMNKTSMKVGFLGATFGRLGSILKGVGSLLGRVFSGALSLIRKVARFLGPIGIAVSAILLVLGPSGLQGVWAKITSAAGTFFTAVRGFFANFQSNVASIFSWLKQNWFQLVAELPKILITAALNMVHNYGVVIAAIPRLFAAFFGWLTARAKEVFGYVFSYQFLRDLGVGFQKGMEIVMSWGTAILDLIGNVVGAAVNLLVEIPKTFFNILMALAKRLGNVLWDVLTGQLDISKVLPDIMADVGKELSASADRIKGDLNKRFNGIAEGFADQLGQIPSDFEKGMADANLAKTMRDILGDTASRMKGPLAGLQSDLPSLELDLSIDSSQEKIKNVTTASLRFVNAARAATSAVQKLDEELGGLGEDFRTEAQMELEQRVNELTKALEEQVFTFGMADREAEIYKLSLAGVADEALAAAREHDKLLTAFEKHQEKMDKGKELTEQYMEPFEKFTKTTDELADLLQLGAIDTDVFEKALKDAKKEFDETIEIKVDFRGVDAIEAGSLEALAALDRFRQEAKAKVEMDDLVQKHLPSIGTVLPAQADVNVPSAAQRIGDDEVDDWLEEIAENTKPPRDVVILRPMGIA